MFIALKPLEERKLSSDLVIARLRRELVSVPGAPAYLQVVQDVRVGGRMGAAQYQYTLQSDNLTDLLTWAPRVEQQLRTLHGVADVNSDQQNKRNAVNNRDRPQHGFTAGHYGPDDRRGSLRCIRSRTGSIMYTLLNQYHVVMEVEPKFWQRPDALRFIYVPSSTGVLVPLSVFTHYEPSTTALASPIRANFRR